MESLAGSSQSFWGEKGSSGLHWAFWEIELSRFKAGTDPIAVIILPNYYSKVFSRVLPEGT